MENHRQPNVGSSLTGSWPALSLEIALDSLKRDQDARAVTAVRVSLSPYEKSAEVPPFALELLDETLRLLGEFKRIEGVSRTSALVRALRRRVAPYSYLIRTATATLTRPFGRGSFSAFAHLADLIADQARGVAPASMTQPNDNSNELLRDWRQRLQMPFQHEDGTWRNVARERKVEVNEIQSEIQRYWGRFDRILDAVPSLGPVRELLIDQARRALSWHILSSAPIPDGDGQRPGEWTGMAIPVFPTLCVGAGFGVKIIGADFGSQDGPDREDMTFFANFLDTARRALAWGLQSWVISHRIHTEPGAGYWTEGNLPEEDVVNSLLVLDFAFARAAFLNVGVPHSLDGNSAGLAIALGIHGLLSRLQVNASTWATGALVKAVPDRYQRQRPATVADVKIGWSDRPELDVVDLKALAAKLLTARSHSVGFHVLLPRARYSAIQRHISRDLTGNGLDGVLATHTKFGFHPIPVGSLSEAATLAFARPTRRRRDIGVLDVEFVPHRIYGSGPWLDDISDFERALLDRPFAVVAGPPLSGKSFAIREILRRARDRHHVGKLLAPRVTYIHLASVQVCHLQNWMLILSHLDFPQANIDRILRQTSADSAAAEFLEAFRAFGPDVLVISGLGANIAHDRQTHGFPSAHFSVTSILGALSRLTRMKPPTRTSDMRALLGKIEFVIEMDTQIAAVPKELKQADLSFPVCPLPSIPSLEFIKNWLARPACRQELKLLCVLSALRHQFSGAEILAAGKQIGLTDAGLFHVVERLTRTHLCGRGDEWDFVEDVSPWARVFDSGPLLRQNGIRFSVNPWLRAASPESLVPKSTLGQFLFDAARICCPACDTDAHGLTPHEGLTPERLLVAVDYLETVANMGIRSSQLGPEARTAAVAILVHYLEPSVGVAFSVERLLKHGRARPSKLGFFGSCESEAGRILDEYINSFADLDRAPRGALLTLSLKLLPKRPTNDTRIRQMLQSVATSAKATIRHDGARKFTAIQDVLTAAGTAVANMTDDRFIENLLDDIELPIDGKKRVQLHSIKWTNLHEHPLRRLGKWFEKRGAVEPALQMYELAALSLDELETVSHGGPAKDFWQLACRQHGTSTAIEKAATRIPIRQVREFLLPQMKLAAADDPALLRKVGAIEIRTGP